MSPISQPQTVPVTSAGQPPAKKASLTFRIGARFTTAARNTDDKVIASRIVNHGPVLLAASQAAAANASGAATARVLRSAARQVAERKPFENVWKTRCRVVGATGVARAVVMLSAGGGSKATLAQIRQATERLGAAWADDKRGTLSEAWIQPLMVGAAVLEALLESLGADEIEVEPAAPRAAGLSTG